MRLIQCPVGGLSIQIPPDVVVLRCLLAVMGLVALFFLESFLLCLSLLSETMRPFYFPTDLVYM